MIKLLVELSGAIWVYVRMKVTNMNFLKMYWVALVWSVSCCVWGGITITDDLVFTYKDEGNGKESEFNIMGYTKYENNESLQQNILISHSRGYFDLIVDVWLSGCSIVRVQRIRLCKSPAGMYLGRVVREPTMVLTEVGMGAVAVVESDTYEAVHYMRGLAGTEAFLVELTDGRFIFAFDAPNRAWTHQGLPVEMNLRTYFLAEMYESGTMHVLGVGVVLYDVVETVEREERAVGCGCRSEEVD